MKWTPGGSSDDIEDRRDNDDSGGSGGFRAGGFGAPHLGIGGVIIVFILSVVFHQDFFQYFSGAPAAVDRPVARTNPGGTPAETRSAEFAKFVINDTQKAWGQLLPDQTGKPYRHAKLVLFRNATQSACGAAESATGPFYCPGDEKVYIDLSFYDELQRRFKAPGEFAQAYVIAHEVGHHIQKLTGTTDKIDALRGRAGEAEMNRASVKLELQADCYAGVWGHFAAEFKNQLDPGDVDQALTAAAAIGDDRLQRQSQGTVQPESFTHGTSAQRMRWFKRGQDSGKPGDCDTFGAASL